MCLINYLERRDNRLAFEQFVESKFGYGTWDAPYWFVGPEEGGGDDGAELVQRLIAWSGLALDNPRYDGLLNLFQYCKEINQPRVLQEDQPTWSKLLSLLGQLPPAQGPPRWFANDAAREPQWRGGWKGLYQHHFLCQPDVAPHGKRVALVDISPLPSRNSSTGAWLWRRIANPPMRQLHHKEFESRTAFLLAENGDGLTRLRRRMNMIRRRIVKFKPKLVIFYGLFREPRLRNAVADAMVYHFDHLAPPDVHHIVRHSTIGGTHLFWIYHPNSWGHFRRDEIQEAMAPHVAPWG
jgi:hypothetical protein